jgi:hypothetical protein
MNRELSDKTATCSHYERLLDECQGALKNWDERRAEIHRSGLQGKKTDDELRWLQAKFARAYSTLQKHTHDCEACQALAIIEGRDSENSPNGFSDSKLYV